MVLILLLKLTGPHSKHNHCWVSLNCQDHRLCRRHWICCAANSKFDAGKARLGYLGFNRPHMPRFVCQLIRPHHIYFQTRSPEPAASWSQLPVPAAPDAGKSLAWEQETTDPDKTRAACFVWSVFFSVYPSMAARFLLPSLCTCWAHLEKKRGPSCCKGGSSRYRKAFRRRSRRWWIGEAQSRDIVLLFCRHNKHARRSYNNNRRLSRQYPASAITSKRKTKRRTRDIFSWLTKSKKEMKWKRPRWTRVGRRRPHFGYGGELGGRREADGRRSPPFTRTWMMHAAAADALALCRISSFDEHALLHSSLVACVGEKWNVGWGGLVGAGRWVFQSAPHGYSTTL